MPLGWLLKPTWLHFGMVLGAKLGPSWHQIAPKIDPKNNQKTYHILYRFLVDFCSISDPTWTPNRGEKCLLCWFMLALGAILEPRWHLDRPRTPPGGPQDRFWTDLGLILDRFWIDFGSILNDLGVHFLINSSNVSTAKSRSNDC